jgi:hypothetical protein
MPFNNPVFFPIYFVTLWCCVCYLMSFLSGWQRLAGKFRAESPFRGFLKKYTSARMRFVDFGHCLNIGANSEGLHLSVMILFRVGTPQLLIPWREIRVGKTTGFWIFKTSQLVLGTDEEIKLSISLALREQLRIAAGTNWPARSQPPSAEAAVL